MSWKMIYLARRNPRLAPEQFAQAWREHSALGAGCTNVRDKVRSVTQCARMLTLPALDGAADDYDGVNLLGIRDLQAAADIWSDAETLAIMRPDEPRVFSTYVREFTLVCREQVMRDGERDGHRAGMRGSCCVTGFLRRRAELTPEQFIHAWHAPDGSQTDAPALQDALRIVHNEVVEAPPPGYEFDGIAEWWFASPEAARSAFAGADLRVQLPRALEDIADLGRSVFMFTEVTHSRP